MIWSGRAGLWDDWVKFQAQARVQRKREEAEAEAFRIEFHNNISKDFIGDRYFLLKYASFLPLESKGHMQGFRNE